MALDVNILIKIMDKQNSLIKELRDLAGEQLQALKTDDLHKVINITSHQEYIGRQLSVLEQQRRVMLDNFSLEHGIEIKHFTDLLQHTDQDDYAAIQNNRDEIIDGCQKLRDEQGLNALLLKQGLKYTERILGVVNPRKSAGYNKNGNIKRAGSLKLVDANV